jgi:4'-phosphopantetheinyl transferase
MALPPFLAPAEVRVWHAPTSDLADPSVLKQALTWLGAAERARYERFSGDEDRRMFLLGRVMARALVGEAIGVPAMDWQWRDGAHGRPEIARPPTALRFNLAHSAGLVVCALAVGRDVGVDVEDLARRSVEPAVVRRYCSPEEIRDIEAQLDRWHARFLRYWTLKEAYLKALGLGISVTLADLSFSNDDTQPRIVLARSLQGGDERWIFHLAQPTDRHLIAVAAATVDEIQPAVSVERVDLAARRWLASPSRPG